MKKMTLALIAHDAKKEEMLSLVNAHREELTNINLVATKKTGDMIHEKTGMTVGLLRHRTQGGDHDLRTMVEQAHINAVIILHDPHQAQPFERELSVLWRVCDAHNTPLATNLAAAEAVIHLMSEHPEALSGHHLLAQYLEEVAAKHD
ncbi:MAG TPA: methylglyoxal synthase [Dehalococcoidales bacterium]|nr:methylglyoxal synthase [Dehalococcoidales bacterium]